MSWRRLSTEVESLHYIDESTSMAHRSKSAIQAAVRTNTTKQYRDILLPNMLDYKSHLSVADKFGTVVRGLAAENGVL